LEIGTKNFQLYPWSEEIFCKNRFQSATVEEGVGEL
jgi:hypothetical protein